MEDFLLQMTKPVKPDWDDSATIGSNIALRQCFQFQALSKDSAAKRTIGEIFQGISLIAASWPKIVAT
jgi:hypothetical protein